MTLSRLLWGVVGDESGLARDFWVSSPLLPTEPFKTRREMSRSYNFCFTLNNPTDSTRAVVDALACKYIVYGEEVSDSGTPHLQGVVCFPMQKTLSAAIKSLPSCHVEIMQGTCQQAITYAKKDGRVTERGTPPVDPGKRERERADVDYAECTRMVKAGRADELDPALLWTRMSTIKAMEARWPVKPADLPPGTVVGLWIYGPTGCGKSHKARTENPDAYIKDITPKGLDWWEGYQREPTVLMEDMDKSHGALAHHLNTWVDRYKFPCSIKGSGAVIRPERIIVTSRYSLEEVFEKEDESTLASLSRRFTVYHMVMPHNQSWQSR